jgi:hypothetical protein
MIDISRFVQHNNMKIARSILAMDPRECQINYQEIRLNSIPIHFSAPGTANTALNSDVGIIILFEGPALPYSRQKLQFQLSRASFYSSHKLQPSAALLQ